MEKEFVALYTGQKQKKAKTWHDGTVKHSGHGNKAVLYDDKGSRLDSIYIKIQDLTVGEQIESDRYLILIEELKHEANTKGKPDPQTQAATVLQRPQFQARCAGLKRKKSGFVPPRMINQQYSDTIENSQQGGNSFMDTRRYGGTDQQGGGLGQTRNVLSIHEIKERVSYTSYSANDDHTKSHEQVSESTAKKSTAVITNALAGNDGVGLNMLNIYNKFGRDAGNQLDSSQGSNSDVDSVKSLSPWSVYGSKTNSPSLGFPQPFSSKITAAAEPNEMNNGPIPTKQGGKAFASIHTTEDTAQTVYMEDSVPQNFETGKTLEASEKVTCKDRFSESIVGSVTSQKRSMDQIMSLLRKKPSKTDDLINTCISKVTDTFLKQTESQDDDYENERTSSKKMNCDTQIDDDNTRNIEITDSFGMYSQTSEKLTQCDRQAECDINNGLQAERSIPTDTKLLCDSLSSSPGVTLNNEVEKSSQNNPSATVTQNSLLGEHCKEEGLQEGDDVSNNDDSFGYFDLTFSPMSNASESDTELPGENCQKGLTKSVENNKPVQSLVQPSVAENHSKEPRTCVDGSVSPGFIKKTFEEQESENSTTVIVECFENNSTAVKSQLLNNSPKETDSDNTVTDKSNDKYREIDNACTNKLESVRINYKEESEETSLRKYKDTYSEIPLENHYDLCKADGNEKFDEYMNDIINGCKVEEKSLGKSSVTIEETCINKHRDETSEKDTYNVIPIPESSSKKDDESQMTCLTQDTMEFSCETLVDDSQIDGRVAEKSADVNDIWSQAKSSSMISRKNYSVVDDTKVGKHFYTGVNRCGSALNKLGDSNYHSDNNDKQRGKESPCVFNQSCGFSDRQRLDIDSFVQQEGQRISGTPTEDSSLGRESVGDYLLHGCMEDENPVHGLLISNDSHSPSLLRRMASSKEYLADTASLYKEGDMTKGKNLSCMINNKLGSYMMKGCVSAVVSRNQPGSIDCADTTETLENVYQQRPAFPSLYESDCSNTPSPSLYGDSNERNRKPADWTQCKKEIASPNQFVPSPVCPLTYSPVPLQTKMHQLQTMRLQNSGNDDDDYGDNNDDEIYNKIYQSRLMYKDACRGPGLALPESPSVCSSEFSQLSQNLGTSNGEGKQILPKMSENFGKQRPNTDLDLITCEQGYQTKSDSYEDGYVQGLSKQMKINKEIRTKFVESPLQSSEEGNSQEMYDSGKTQSQRYKSGEQDNRDLKNSKWEDYMPSDVSDELDLDLQKFKGTPYKVRDYSVVKRPAELVMKLTQAQSRSIQPDGKILGQVPDKTSILDICGQSDNKEGGGKDLSKVENITPKCSLTNQSKHTNSTPFSLASADSFDELFTHDDLDFTYTSDKTDKVQTNIRAHTGNTNVNSCESQGTSENGESSIANSVPHITEKGKMIDGTTSGISLKQAEKIYSADSRLGGGQIVNNNEHDQLEMSPVKDDIGELDQSLELSSPEFDKVKSVLETTRKAYSGNSHTISKLRIPCITEEMKSDAANRSPEINSTRCLKIMSKMKFGSNAKADSTNESNIYSTDSSKTFPSFKNSSTILTDQTPCDSEKMGESTKKNSSSHSVVNKRFKAPTIVRPVSDMNMQRASPKTSSSLSRFTTDYGKSHLQCVSSTQLHFPSRTQVDQLQNVLRQVIIPERFPSANLYKQTLIAAVTEYINCQLLEVAKRYFHALSRVDTSGYAQGTATSGSSGPNATPRCQCGAQSKMVMVKKQGANQGRYFYACSANRNQQCKFFQWADENTKGCKSNVSSKRVIKNSMGLNLFMKDHRVHFYGDSQFVIRTKENIKNYFKAPKWMRNRVDPEVMQKKQMILKLPYKGHSSIYAKDDLWVVSRSLDFDAGSTFIAKSTYHGPTAGQEVEIEPLVGYSPSNWPTDSVCQAVLASNASSELSCIDNIREHIQATSPPIITQLLCRIVKLGQILMSSHNMEISGEIWRNDETIQDRNQGRFTAPRMVQSSQRNTELFLPSETMDELSQTYIQRYQLNQDQAEAVRRVANMFSAEKTHQLDDILLIHGVFGAGKSFLLSVVVLFLEEVFDSIAGISTPDSLQWKLLISSTTNVAVDRILNGLLDLGFEEFVRVGSVKKIAKSVLPYSVHATGTDSQELRDLQEMLRSGDLTAAEKSNVRKSIEKHRCGENKKKLSRVRVVGATCAACSLACLTGMEFPLVLLDECSQMTEPASLLPIARFSSRKLILVGDPKQLAPTIQSVESAHKEGLEQTMFDRLLRMGHIPTLLRTQYRCHPYISALANKLFYGGMLDNGVTEADRHPLVDFLPTICMCNVENGQESCERAGSYYNEEEAQFVVFLLQVLLEAGLEPAALGVITLYRSQMARIMDLLAVGGSETDMKGIQVSTVDAFQGGEKDVIILSCVRTNSCGFIDSDKRMTVALTRAKHHLFIVGHCSNLSTSILWSKVIDHCKAFKNGVQSAEEVKQTLELHMDMLRSNKSESQDCEILPASDNSVSKNKKKGRKRKTSRESTQSQSSYSEVSDKENVAVKRKRVKKKDSEEVTLGEEEEKTRDLSPETTDNLQQHYTDEPILEPSCSLNEHALPMEPENFTNTEKPFRQRHADKLKSCALTSDNEDSDQDLPEFNCG